MNYIRPHAAELERRLKEPRLHIHVVSGPRQVGKTTLVRQVCQRLGMPWRYASADEPSLRGAHWIEQQWEAARLEAEGLSPGGSVLVLDEIHKIAG